MEAESDTNNLTSRNQEQEMEFDLFKYVSYQPGRDSVSDARGALLVVAALIAAVTFDKVTSFHDSFAGAGNNYFMFLFFYCNTMAFSASMAMIEFLTNGFPFERELRMATAHVFLAYGIAAAYSFRESGKPGYIVIGFAMLTPYLLRMVPKWINDGIARREM